VGLKTLILRDRENGVLKISQEQFTREFLANSKATATKFPATKSPASSPNFPDGFSPDEKLDRIDESLKRWPKFQGPTFFSLCIAARN